MYRRLDADPDLAEKFKIISINDPDGPYLFGNTNKADYGHLFAPHGNVLSLCFHDVDKVYPGYTLFSEEDAVKVIEFLTEKVYDGDNLLVHCFAGISRSGAVGTFARELYGLDYDSFLRMNRQIVPNRHVLSTLTFQYQAMYGEPHHNSLRYNHKVDK